jgi:small-conductance mechanosensitive channel
MERMLQYLDDIDDLLGAVGLVYERLRSLFLKLVSLLAGLSVVALSVVLALKSPTLALAMGLLLSLMLLYRIVSASSRDSLPSV